MSDKQFSSSMSPKPKTAYNIDLFSSNQEESKTKGRKKSRDVDMQEESKDQKKTKVRAEDGSDGSGDGSSSSSGSNSSSSDSDINEEANKPATEHIEVPVSVVQRFFSKKEVLTSYLQKVNEENTFALLDVSQFRNIQFILLQDLCQTYKFEEGTKEELTELSYILYECLKSNLVSQDMMKCKYILRFLFNVHSSAAKMEIARLYPHFQLSHQTFRQH